MDYNRIAEKFKEKFGKEPRVFRSPGRINIIGEHTDYNEGFVLPAAIDKAIWAAIGLNGSEYKVRLYAFDLDESFAFDLRNMQPDELGWPNYIMGVVDQIIKRGLIVEGFDCVIGGDVPLGAGLSSSAALESVIAYGVNELFKLDLLKIDIIKIAQQAEHVFAGVNCGIMDQYASVMGKKDRVFRLDCQTLQHDYFPMELGDYQILLINSNVKHSLASTEYNTRRKECEEGVSVLHEMYPLVKSLRDVSSELLDKHRNELRPLVLQRCRFVVEENERVLKSCDALNSGDLNLLGELIYQSHEGLSKDYEVSCQELDFLVDFTKDKDYILGARMMGGGFGGCSLNLILKQRTQEFLHDIEFSYQAEFGKKLTPIIVSIEDGSTEIVLE